MYRFHYQVIKPTFPESALCFTDTDSFLYYIETQDLYGQLSELKDFFDFSNYEKHHPLYSAENKSVVGKFKDETHGIPISEFVGLRSKMYSLLTVEGEQKNTAAGVKNYVAKKLTHDLYRQVLLGQRDQEDYVIRQTTFRSFLHTVFTVDSCKVGLTRYDDKRFILSDGVTTRPHGHFRNY